MVLMVVVGLVVCGVQFLLFVRGRCRAQLITIVLFGIKKNFVERKDIVVGVKDTLGVAFGRAALTSNDSGVRRVSISKSHFDGHLIVIMRADGAQCFFHR